MRCRHDDPPPALRVLPRRVSDLSAVGRDGALSVVRQQRMGPGAAAGPPGAGMTRLWRRWWHLLAGAVAGVLIALAIDALAGPGGWL